MERDFCLAANIAKFLAAYLSLIIGFSLALAVLFPEEESLAKLPFSLLTTIVMMTGELEYKGAFDWCSEILEIFFVVSLHLLSFIDYFNADDGLPEYLVKMILSFKKQPVCYIELLLFRLPLI